MQRMGNIFLYSVDFLQVFHNVQDQLASFEVEDADDLVSKQNGCKSAMWA